MKVIVKGELNVEQFAKKLIEVAEHTANKVEQDNEGVKINSFAVHEAEVTFKFDVEGLAESQVMTVEHFEGKPELLTWIVDTDTDTTANNEQESLFDAWSVAKAEGKDFDFKEIESQYEDDYLVLEDSEQFGDMSKEIYRALENDFKVVRVYQGTKLIQEYKLIPKEKE